MVHQGKTMPMSAIMAPIMLIMFIFNLPVPQSIMFLHCKIYAFPLLLDVKAL
jgi:hypothetical protein